MGLRDALKRSKATVTLAAEPADLLPGEKLQLRVTVEGEIDDKAQGARAGLRCVHSYLVRERDHDDDGPGDVDEVWRHMTLHEEYLDLPLATGTTTHTLAIPAGAAPSSAQVVSWTAWASLDRRMGLDVSESVPLRVRGRADALPTELPPAEPGEGGLRFAGLPARVRAGGALEGVLEITPPDDVKATAVTLTLRRVRTYVAKAIEEWDPDRVGGLTLGRLKVGLFEDGVLTIGSADSRVVKREEVAEVEVSGKREFAAGATERLPFSIPVPADAGPTVVVPHGVVTWEVEATLKRRLRGDHEVKAVVGVHDERA